MKKIIEGKYKFLKHSAQIKNRKRMNWDDVFQYIDTPTPPINRSQKKCALNDKWKGQKMGK